MEGMTETSAVDAMIVTTEGAADMVEVMTEIDAIVAADLGAEATAVVAAVVEALVQNMDDVEVAAALGIVLDVIVIPGEVLRTVIPKSTRVQPMEWVRVYFHLHRLHLLVVLVCICRWASIFQDFSQDNNR